MAVFNVRDANGSEFSVDDTKIADINGDLVDAAGNQLGIKDSARESFKPHTVEVVDSKGTALDASQVIADMDSGSKNIIALDVQAESTHSGKNHNYCIYYEDSMEKDAETFMAPYHKPMLKNHDEYRGEPLGRITSAWFGPSALTDERSAIHTITRVVDSDAIRKFLDGRYQTLSIGGSMGTCTCNICGKSILKDGKFKFCGHWRGETYKDQVCYWGARDITYNEHSTVNNPADDFAQVVKLTVVTNEDKQNNDSAGRGENRTMDEKNKTKQAIFDMIDQLVGSNAGTAGAVQDNAGTSQQAQQPAGQQTQAQQTEQQPSAATATDSEKVKELQAQLNDAVAAKEKAEKALADEKVKVAEAEKQRDDALADTEIYKNKCVTLAEGYKTVIADAIIEKENVQDAEARKKELIAMSMAELNAVHDSLTKQRRTPGTAQNPTVPNGGEHNAPVGDNTAQDNKGGSVAGISDSNQKLSLDDYVNRIVNRKR